MQAMILAAGFGTRLLPYTNLRPKPLFPLLGEPLLLLTIKRLQNAGFDHIIVNCHYLKEQIVDALVGMQGVVVQQEETILGTGGGLRMALPLMRDEPILISNGDIYHTIDYKKMVQAHCSGTAAVTMAMHDYPRFNTVSVRSGQVTEFGARSGNRLAFTGVHVLDPEILKSIAPAEKNCIVARYGSLLQEGGTITARRVDGCNWTDMGTVDDYLALHGRLLTGETPLWPEFSNKPQGPFLVHELCDINNITLHEWACVGKAHSEAAVSLTGCVVWDGARIKGDNEFSHCLLV
jgi:mannose-1-phosphate guanylyltransferase